MIIFLNFFLIFSSIVVTRLADMPECKQQHGFQECQGMLYAVGGYDNKKVFCYDIEKNEWSIKADLPFLEKDRQSAILREVNGKLYFIGGWSTCNEIQHGDLMHNETYEYDPEINKWTQKASMSTHREDFGSAVFDGKIYCFGGWNCKEVLRNLEVYDPVSDTWQVKTPMPHGKCLGDFGAECNGKIYAIGASNNMKDYPFLNPDSTVFEYDPISDVWTEKKPIPLATCYRELESIDDKIYVVIGVKMGNYKNVFNLSPAIYMYNTRKDSWLKISDAPYRAMGTALAKYKDKIYICGGAYNGDFKCLYSIKFK